MAPSLLLIPAELQVIVFGNLDAKTIQRARRICRELKELIDANQATFAKAIQKSEIARLQAFIDHHDYRNLPFLQALRRWIKHRAILANGHIGLYHPTTFIIHFMASRTPTCDFALSDPFETMSLVALILEDHFKDDPSTSEPRVVGEYFQNIVQEPGKFAEFYTLKFSSMDRDLCWEVCKDVAAHPDDFVLDERPDGVKGLGYFVLGKSGLLMPIHCLTKLCLRGPLPGIGVRGHYTKPSKHGEIKIQQILDVPSLLPGDVFAYCALDRWTEQKILEANAAISTAATTTTAAPTTAVPTTAAPTTAAPTIAAPTIAAPTMAAPTTAGTATAGNTIDPLLKAALLERVFIY